MMLQFLPFLSKVTTSGYTLTALYGFEISSDPCLHSPSSYRILDSGPKTKWSFTHQIKTTPSMTTRSFSRTSAFLKVNCLIAQNISSLCLAFESWILLVYILNTSIFHPRLGYQMYEDTKASVDGFETPTGVENVYCIYSNSVPTPSSTPRLFPTPNQP